ncbi:MAG: 5-(carboxyamino)imidazole ribonucleotide mutase [Acidobacteria bacterium]|nr:5-(carboxyamino)imidazole ribonucleotide mutase [Acidobacteriota bacterium]
MPERQPLVLILMGSDSDLETMKPTLEYLTKFGIAYEIEVSSAHRSPKRTLKFASEAGGRGIKAIIVGAGMAAHLAGVIAAETTLPVIGVPIDASPLRGVDALYSTVQMPPGIPVATMAIGPAGAANAAILAAQIIALSNKKIADLLIEFKKELASKVEKKSEALKNALRQ